jgi:hypothetical protein
VRKLEDIIEDFNTMRETFHNYVSTGEIKKESLLELQTRFVGIKSDLTYWKAKAIKNWTRTDDKAATAIKYRITVAISRGDFTDTGATLPLPKCSLSHAEKLAAGTNTYKEFIDKRAFNKESMTNLSDVREDCANYINLIKDFLK